MSFLLHNVVLHWFPYRASRQCLSNKGFCAPSLCSSFFAWPLYLIILGWYLSWLLPPSLTSLLNWDHEMNAEAAELSPAERSSETPKWKAGHTWQKRDIKRTANMCREDMWRETIRTERTTFLENEDVPANYRCTRKTAERMEDNYYCWRLFPIMELLCKMRRKTKPEHKDEICVARWTGGIYIWPANLASPVSTQANKQNNTSLRTGLRGPALTANTDIKRNNGRRRRKHSGKIGAKPW